MRHRDAWSRSVGRGSGRRRRIEAWFTVATLVAWVAGATGCGGGGGDVSGTDETQPVLVSIGGQARGLTGAGLVLQNNGADDLALATDGPFTFATRLAAGTTYAVTVLHEPAGQRCQVDGGTGVARVAVSDVLVTCSTVSTAVKPLYPAHGADWNDYVADDGASPLLAGDQPCDDVRCLHAGELRIWQVPQLTSCSGLEARDALDAFDWVCEVRDGSAAFISTGLKPGRGLADLIDFDTPGWRGNQILVSGAASLASPPGAWWARPVHDVVDCATLDLPHVHLLRTDATGTCLLVADRAALVMRPGVVLRGPGGGDSVVTTGFVHHVWVEGVVEAAGALRGVHLQQAVFSVLRRLDVRGAAVGVAVDWGGGNRLADLRVHGNTGHGIEIGQLGGSSANHLVDVAVVDNGGDGLRLGNNPGTSPGHAVHRLVAANNAGLGLLVMRQRDSRLQDVTAFANGQGGVGLLEAPSTWLAGATVANNDGAGLAASGANLTLQQVGAVNNAGSGLLLSAGTFRVVDAAAAVNAQAGLFLTSAASAFSGELRVGGNAGGDCVVGTGSTGLVSVSCENEGASDAVLTRGLSVSAALVGKLLVDETVNTSDTLGAADHDAITDWLQFARPRRGWGSDGAAFPDAAQRLRCTAGTCRIWDWNLAVGDGALRAVLAPPSGDDVLVHRWSATDAAACLRIAGAVWDAGTSRCTSTLLRRAAELAGDAAGNDNGLCEAGERCLVTPNIGSYPGHGGLVELGTTTGTLPGIGLQRHELDGY